MTHYGYKYDYTRSVLSISLIHYLVHNNNNLSLHVKSEDYGISDTCYPYTPILIRLPPKFQPYPTSRADIVELRNCFAVES